MLRCKRANTLLFQFIVSLLRMLIICSWYLVFVMISELGLKHKELFVSKHLGPICIGQVSESFNPKPATWYSVISYMYKFELHKGILVLIFMVYSVYTW